MNREALREFFDYTTFTWASYGNSVRSLPSEAFTRPVDGSGWPSLRDALFHIASSWNDWLCQQTGATLTILEATDVTGWDELSTYREKLRGLVQRMIDGSSDDELSAPARAVEPGQTMQISRGELIGHILLHERGHHGDVSTLLQGLGVAPPGSDYIVYVYFRNRNK